MSVSVYILECVVMCAVFGVFVFGMLLVNPVSFIGDYPPEIQAQYYSSQRKEVVKVTMNIPHNFPEKHRYHRIFVCVCVDGPHSGSGSLRRWASVGVWLHDCADGV